VLAHQKHFGRALGQAREALLQHPDEVLALERLFRPGPRRLAPVAGGVEECIEVFQ
jgi:hypothetical protein